MCQLKSCSQDGKMEIRTSDLLLIKEALETQIRLSKSFVNKTRDDEIKILRFENLLSDIEVLILNR